MSFAAESSEVARIMTRIVRAQLRIGPGTRGTTCVVLDHQGRMLLVKTRYHRGWSACGGFLDPQEDPAEGMRRELTEEAGLPATAPTPVLHRQLTRGRHRDYLFTLQLDADCAAALRVSSWELHQIGWFSPFDLPRLLGVAATMISGSMGIVEVADGRWVWGPQVSGTDTPIGSQAWP